MDEHIVTSRFRAERRAVVETAREMAEKGLVVGAAGNVSMRIRGEEMLAITPSRKAYHDLGAEDIQIIDFEAGPVEGDALPSVESLVHIGVYRARADAGRGGAHALGLRQRVGRGSPPAATGDR